MFYAEHMNYIQQSVHVLHISIHTYKNHPLSYWLKLVEYYGQKREFI